MAARRPVVLVVLIAMLGVVACDGGRGTKAAPAALTFSVNVAHPGAVVPDDFLGLSFEASVLDSTPTQSNLAALLRDLAAGHGIAGVDVHGGLAACRGYTPICLTGVSGPTAASRPGVDPTADLSLGAGSSAGGRLTVQPDFYGSLVVRQLEGGHWLAVRPDRRTPVQAFAVVMTDGTMPVVLDNPDGRFVGNVTVRTACHRWSATVLRLTAPSLGATSGVRFGSAGVTPDGAWHPQADHIPSPVAGEVRLQVSPASAAVVTLFPSKDNARR